MPFAPPRCSGGRFHAWFVPFLAMTAACGNASSVPLEELTQPTGGGAQDSTLPPSIGTAQPQNPALTIHADAPTTATGAGNASAAGSADARCGTGAGSEQLAPLFRGETTPLPVSFTRADGVLVTRAAGRVRGRHELEGSFGPFHADYFEHRTYGFLIEDYTPRGESRIVVTYLPVARPTDGTNFRAWKIYGNGNVFNANTGMTSDGALPSLAPIADSGNYARSIAPFARVQKQETTRNARTGKPIAAGDLFEFEFGVFIEAGAVRSGTRTNYYTDTFRYRAGTAGLTPESADASGKLGPLPEAWLGGRTTIAHTYAEPELAFEQLASNVQHENVQRFVEGRRLFHTDFGTGAHTESGNPALPEQAGKLGPSFVASSCAQCHVHNGGGRTLSVPLDTHASMTFKLYTGEVGAQLTPQTGSATPLSADTRTVMLNGEGSVTLQRPRFDVRDAQKNALPHSARIARRLPGLGLLEAIAEDTLLGLADPDDCDGDGVSGRVSIVRDPETGETRVGRFGWRAEKVSLRHQVGDALRADLGVTSAVLPEADGRAELNEADVTRLTTYMRLLGVPAQRDASDVEVKRGEQLFHDVGCASCHVSALTTGQTHPFAELRSQTIRPYTDLLLHDLGEGLADASAQDGAQEWRTAPLWGAGLSETIQGHVSLLHDGRAHSVLEAVLWHGGEAAGAEARFTQLSPADRKALLRFVASL
ncbi:MAG: hypothetical protein RL385_3869 [Pseudomonadota bacterium]